MALGDDADFHIDLIVKFEIVLRTISPYVESIQLAQELFEATSYVYALLDSKEKCIETDYFRDNMFIYNGCKQQIY